MGSVHDLGPDATLANDQSSTQTSPSSVDTSSYQSHTSPSPSRHGDLPPFAKGFSAERPHEWQRRMCFVDTQISKELNQIEFTAPSSFHTFQAFLAEHIADLDAIYIAANIAGDNDYAVCFASSAGQQVRQMNSKESSLLSLLYLGRLHQATYSAGWEIWMDDRHKLWMLFASNVDSKSQHSVVELMGDVEENGGVDDQTGSEILEGSKDHPIPVLGVEIGPATLLGINGPISRNVSDLPQRYTLGPAAQSKTE